MEWWKDSFSRNIRKREVKRIWYLIILPIFMLILIIILVYYQASKIGQTQTPIDVTINALILPALLSILISWFAFSYKKWDKNCQWAEQEVVVYSDILECFTKILIAFEKDFTKDSKKSYFEQDSRYANFLDNIQKFRNIIKENGKDGYKQTNHYAIYNVEGLIGKLSTQYLSIILHNCTKEPVRLFYSLIVMHLIKLDEDVKQYKTNVPVLKNNAQENIMKMLYNYTETLQLLYKIIYPVFIEGMGGNMVKQNINYYEENMFGNITKDNDEQRMKLRKEALTRAWDTRNFEINLYWHRAAYFWAFNTAMGVACYNVAKHNINENLLILSVLLLVGFACSIAWVFVNIASKHWQENWESHIRLLEKQIEGRLYATTISDYENPSRPSVSRMNLKVSIAVFFAWVAILIAFNHHLYTIEWWRAVLFFITAVAITIFMAKKEISNWNNISQLLFEKKDYASVYTNTLDVNDIDICNK